MAKTFILLIMLGICSCGSLTSNLPFIDDQNFTSDTQFKNLPLGGLSGIRYHAQRDEFYTISDDRSEHGPARLYVWKGVLNDNLIELRPTRQIILKDKKKKNFLKNDIDFEGIALDQDEYFISSEGYFREKKIIPPAIFHFNKKGILKKQIHMPEHFNPNFKTRGTWGNRKNLALESLANTRDGQYLFTANEEALVQDGNIADYKTESTLRILRLKKDKKGHFQFDQEFPYRLSVINNKATTDNKKGENGLVDFIALDHQRLITLERSWLPKLKKQVIRIYLVHLEGATNTLKIPQLKGQSLKFAKKTLLSDLDTIVAKMDPKFKRLDNFEGICFGPRFKDGSRSIVLVSDNNFSKYQRTLFLALKLPKGLID